MPQDITNPNNNPNLGLVMAQVDDADGNIVVTLIDNAIWFLCCHSNRATCEEDG